MSRPPTWDERMLVRVTLNTGESPCIAVAAENFDPNMAIRAGDAAIVLKTSRLAAAEGLPASTLEDLEQCAPVALLLA